MDELIGRYYLTVPSAEPGTILGNVVRHLTEQVVVIPLAYFAYPQLKNDRLKNVEPLTSWSGIPSPQRWDLA